MGYGKQHHPPAICRDCRAIFPHAVVTFGTRPFWEIADCVSTCPDCGGTADVVSGRYRFYDDGFAIVQSSSLSREQLRELVSLIGQIQGPAKLGEDTRSEVLDAIGAVDPALAKLVELYRKRNIGLIALVLLLTLVVRQCGGSAPLIEIDASTTIIEAPAETGDVRGEPENWLRPHRDGDWV